MSTASLVQELRNRVKDSRNVIRAFGISVRDANVTSAVVEVSNGYFRVVVTGGSTSSLNINLADPVYAKLDDLVRAIATLPGYVVSQDSDMDGDYVSVSLANLPPTDCNGRQVDITHRLFSDQWLGDLIRRALQRHNPSMPTVDALPVAEEELVLTLAHSMLLTNLATDSSRRRGLTTSTEELLRLSKSLEDSYRYDMVRLARAIQSPREASSNIMREGDIVVGKFNLRKRGGSRTSLGNIPPELPKFVDGLEIDIEDTSVVLRWERSADSNFSLYQLWQGIDPDVEKDRAGYSLVNYAPVGPLGGRDALSVTAGRVTGLEPETQYYFRLYVVDRNGEFTGSDVVSVTTLPLRVKISETTPPTPVNVSNGDVVTVTFDPRYAAPNSDMKVFVGEKEAIFTVTGAWTIEVTVPNFFNKGPKVLAVLSPLRTCFSYLVLQ